MKRTKSAGMYPALRILRILTAALVLAGFVAGMSLSSIFFDRILSLLVSVQFLPALLRLLLSGTALALSALVPLLVIGVLTVLVGRVYCSVLCPLGILQDLLLFLSRKLGRQNMRHEPSRMGFHAAVWSASVILAAAGLPALLSLLEPYAFFGRIHRDVFVPLTTLSSTAIVEILKNYEIYLAPVPFRGELRAVLSSLALLATLIFLTLRWGRWYCNRLCPAGFMLRLLSIHPVFGLRLKREDCITCGLCTRVCRAACIDLENHSLATDRCVLCFDCAAACPTGAIAFQPARNHSPDIRDISRRRTLLSAAGTLLAAGSAWALSPLKNLEGPAALPETDIGNPEQPVLPPGAISRSHYSARCISCHTCVSSCPTHVLQPSFFALGLRGFLQPVMDYRSGYCEWECNTCSTVCPTGAIAPIQLEEKKMLQMGTVSFIQDRCVVFTKGTACGACAEVCPTGAVWMAPYQGELTQPLTDTVFCSGCGSCQHACPVEGEKAILVQGLEEHGRRKEKPVDQQEEEEPGSQGEEFEEFPF